MVLGLAGCGARSEIVQENSTNTELVSSEEFKEEKNPKAQTDKDHADKKEVKEKTTEVTSNPKPNEKPVQETEEAEKLNPTRVEKLRVNPDKLQAATSQDGSDEDLGDGYIRTPKLRIKDGAVSTPLVDVYLLDGGDELFDIENQLGIRISITEVETGEEEVLLVPKHYHGLMKINRISYNSNLDGYKIGEELLNVYMSDTDAILFRADLSADKPNYMVSYYDEAGTYMAQTFLRYSPESKTLSLDNGFNF